MRGGSASPRGRRAVAAAVCLLLGAVTQGCGDTAPVSPPDPGPGAPAATSPVDLLARRGLCTDERSRCVPLADGATAVVYPAAAGGLSAPTILWEPGGPGLAPPTPGEARTVLPGWTGSYDVALVVERWVLHPPSPACLSALTAQVFAGGRDDLATCDPSSLQYSPAEYGEIAGALDAAAGPLVGVYATSFGATRVEAERAAVDHDLWAVVDAPAPVPGSDAETLFTARARAVERSVVRVPACDPGGCRARSTSLTSFLRAPGSEGQPTGTDRAFAVLALSHDPAESRAWLERLWATRGSPSEADLETVQDAALTYTHRRSVDEAEPELAGYVFGMCAAYRGWADGPPPDDPLVLALRVLHGPCRTTTDAPPSPGRAGGPTLLLLNEDDLVTPIRMQRTWVSRLPGATVLTYADAGHGAAPRRLQAATRRWISRHSTGAR